MYAGNGSENSLYHLLLRGQKQFMQLKFNYGSVDFECQANSQILFQMFSVLDMQRNKILKESEIKSD